MGLVNLNSPTTSFYSFSNNPFSPAIAYPGDPNGALGSLRLTGNNAGWQGFQFIDSSRSLLVSQISQGFYAPNQWLWRFDNGTLSVGNVPWASLNNNPFSISNQPYSTIAISGIKNAYQGFEFTEADKGWLIGSEVQGIFNYTTSAWDWYFQNGTLRNAYLPASSVLAGAFLATSAPYDFVRNTQPINNASYSQGAIQIYTSDGSRPILGFHRGGVDALALYYNGANELRIRGNTGTDKAIALESSGGWMPVFKSTSMSYNTYTSGNWSQSGKIVVANFVILVSNKGNPAGDVIIQGLPLPAKQSSYSLVTTFLGAIKGSFSGLSSGQHPSVGLRPGSSELELFWQSQSAFGPIQWSNLPISFGLFGSISYLTD